MPENLPRLDLAPPRGVWGLIVLAGVMFIALNAAGRQDEAPAVTAPRSTNLFVLVQVRNKEVTPKMIRTTFVDAINNLSLAPAEISVQPLEPGFYRALQNLTDRLDSSRTGGTKDRPFVRQRGMADKLVEWELHLNRAGAKGPAYVEAVDLTFEEDKKKGVKGSTRTIKPTSTQPTAEMSPTPVPDVFVVRLPVGELPAKFTVHARAGGLKPVKLEGEWAQLEQFFLVAVKNFAGSHQKVLEEVQSDRVSNRLDDAIIGQDLTFVFASYGFKLPRTGTFDGNEYIPVLAPLPDRPGIARVWMLFPLTEKQAVEELERYRKEDVETLPQKIRESKPLFAADNPSLTLDGKAATRWIELPPTTVEKAGRTEVTGFQRRIKIENVRELQKSYPSARRLVVYEFQRPGGDPRAEAVEDRDTGKLVMVTNEEVKEWPAGIAGLAAREKPAKDTGKDGGKDKDK